MILWKRTRVWCSRRTLSCHWRSTCSNTWCSSRSLGRRTCRRQQLGLVHTAMMDQAMVEVEAMATTATPRAAADVTATRTTIVTTSVVATPGLEVRMAASHEGVTLAAIQCCLMRQFRPTRTTRKGGVGPVAWSVFGFCGQRGFSSISLGCDFQRAKYTGCPNSCQGCAN